MGKYISESLKALFDGIYFFRKESCKLFSNFKHKRMGLRKGFQGLPAIDADVDKIFLFLMLRLMLMELLMLMSMLMLILSIMLI